MTCDFTDEPMTNSSGMLNGCWFLSKHHLTPQRLTDADSALSFVSQARQEEERLVKYSGASWINAWIIGELAVGKCSEWTVDVWSRIKQQ